MDLDSIFESVGDKMGIEIANVAFSLVFLIWGLVETWKQRKQGGDEQLIYAISRTKFFDKITVASNIIISFLYIGLSYQEFVFSKTHNLLSISSAFTWILASLITIYCFRKHPKWPLVLNIWWTFSLIFETLLLSISKLTSFKVPYFIPRADYSDFILLPLLVLLCFTSYPSKNRGEKKSMECPLLEDEVESEKQFCEPFSEAGILSHLTFRWLNPLFEIGRNQKLELAHIPCIPQSESASFASSLLEESIRNQKKETFSLPKAATDAVWISLVVNGVFAGLNTISSYMGPLLITGFVNILSSKQENSSYYHGLIIAFIIFFSKTVESLSQRQWYYGAQRIGIRIRAALMVLIYKKTLLIKYGGMSNGKVMNYISVDVERIGEFFLHIHGVWLLPLQVTLALIILHINLGALPTFAALLTTILVMVSNTPLAKLQERFHSKIMEAKDARIKSTWEILKSMRVLKFHSWENNFLEKLLNFRENERKWLAKYLYTCSAICFLFWASPTLVSVVTFGVCILLKTPLTPATVLSALATFRILQEPIHNLPELMSMIAQTKVSIDRVQEFLKGDQKKIIQSQPSDCNNVAVEIEIGEYSWDMKKPTIKITEKIKIIKGNKVAICGSVGSGKSSLLYSILGEIPRINGSVIRVCGSKAFVPQKAWIQTGTVRENVLFGKEMIKGFYDEVIEGCALNQDIEMWTNKDLCVVGERGINLSGGQKQRIQLARGIYGDSDVYFLDDPFSAVDAHTGAHLFKNCLSKLLSEKTVLYVTHQLEFLEAADLVLVMKDGRISQSGKYEDLIKDLNGELVQQMAAHGKSLSQFNSDHNQNTATKGILYQKNQVEITGESQESGKVNPSEKSQEEETETGRVKWSVYYTFITCAYGGGLVPFTLLCHSIFYGLQIASNYWVAWASDEKRNISSKQMIFVFALLSGGSSFFILGRTLLLSTIAIETGRRLFLGMITSIFRAPLSFFDTTPSSRILNRSSTDQSTVDTDIPYRVAGLVFALIQLFSIIILMSQIAWPVFFLFVAIIAISVWYQCYYITSARELARMAGTRRAPILHHVSESLSGAATIRCFNQEDNFLNKTLKLIDDYSRVAFHNSATMEWLCVRINTLFNFAFFLVLVILVSLPRSTIDPSMAGLVAVYGLSLNVVQAWVIWNICNVENKMISVERILQFTKIPSEAPLIIEHNKPKPEWPICGKIELENLYVQYDPSLPIVLKGVSCIFPGNKKIGIVGRTGSGKSTLIQALFRVVEPSWGRILIDGLDISKIGLQDLRSKLSIIPQDPTLFQGTMRSNIDPLEQFSDLDIWQVLEKCRLADVVKQDQRGLDMPVAEDGENWSVGQRQLVCLARVLLQKRKILVLDEATASMDTATDNIIQSRIREETSMCTVITVAHRINTIIDNDLVLVLDEGKVVEFDSPDELLKEKLSAFSRLVNEFVNRSLTNQHR